MPGALTARLAATARPAGDLASIDDSTAAIRMFNPVAHAASPLAPPLRHDSGDADVTGSVILGPESEGHAGYVHGGTIALLFDDALARVSAPVNRPHFVEQGGLRTCSITRIHPDARHWSEV